jgi:hypothetical protein
VVNDRSRGRIEKHEIREGAANVDTDSEIHQRSPLSKAARRFPRVVLTSLDRQSET